MSAFRPGKTRTGPWMMTPLLVLVLLAALAGPVLCQEAEETGDEAMDDTGTDTGTDTSIDPDTGADATDIEGTTNDLTQDTTVIPTTSDAIPTQDPSITESNITPDPTGAGEGELSGEDSGEFAGEEPIDGTASSDELSPTIILVPVVLVVVIIGMVVGGIVINRRCNRTAGDADHGKADPYLDENSTEKVPMPMFEEDVPSVLELEMEEFDEWMNKDGGAGIQSDHI